jgi:hypothetical protein
VVGLVRLVGVLLALVVATGVATTIAGGLKGQLMAVQLGRDPVAVHKLVLDAGRRGAMRRGLWFDFGFLASYWLAFVGVAILLGHRGTAGYVLGAVAALAATATALLDVTENVRTFGVIARHRAGDVLAAPQLDELRRVSLMKWTFSSITVAVLAATFVHHGRILWIAIALVASAVVGLLGILWNPLLRLYMLAVAVAAGFLAVLFLGWPDTILRGL